MAGDRHPPLSGSSAESPAPALAGRILLTGAAGRIGSVVRHGLRGRYPAVRLLDVIAISDAQEGEEVVTADLRDLPSVEAAMADVDAVVHLGAISGEAAFTEICEHNIVGTYHVFEAARLQGATRVVYASSNHATGFYRESDRIGPEAPVRPDTHYGVSKVFGEAVARLYADKFGLEAACLRIGSFRPRPQARRELATWLSHRDAVELVRCCIDVPDLGFAIVYGVSANTRGWWDNPEADRIGYRPVDDAEDFAAEVLAHDAEPGPGEARFQGGPFTAVQTTADTVGSPDVPPMQGAMVPDVLFVCVHNAGRSRMAEALFNREAAGRYTAASAGTEPADRPHPEVVTALAEVGIDLDGGPGTMLDADLADAAGRVISMGCNVEEACPATTVETEDWALDDPRGQPIERVREIRDDIAGRVRALVAEFDSTRGY